jgi:hypothetical protein
MTRQTSRAVAADSTEPLDTNAVANLHIAALSARAHLDDLAYALVATDLVGLCGVRQRDPAVGHNAQIGVTDSGVSAVIVRVSFTR